MTQPSLETDSSSPPVLSLVGHETDTRLVLQDQDRLEPCETNEYDDSCSDSSGLSDDDGRNHREIALPSGAIQATVQNSTGTTIAHNLTHITGPVTIHNYPPSYPNGEANGTLGITHRETPVVGDVPSGSDVKKNEPNNAPNNSSTQGKRIFEKVLLFHTSTKVKYCIVFSIILLLALITTLSVVFTIKTSSTTLISSSTSTATTESTVTVPIITTPTVVTTSSTSTAELPTNTTTVSTTSTSTTTTTEAATTTTAVPTTPEPSQDLNGYPLFSRSQWLAEPSNKPGTGVLGSSVPLVIIAHSSTEFCDGYTGCAQLVRDIQQRDFLTKFDISYNFLVGGDGSIYEGRGWKYTNLYKARSIMFAFMGDFNRDELNENMTGAVEALLDYGTGKTTSSIWSTIKEDYQLVGQNQTDVNYKDSPGENVCKEIYEWANYYSGTIYT